MSWTWQGLAKLALHDAPRVILECDLLPKENKRMIWQRSVSLLRVEMTRESLIKSDQSVSVLFYAFHSEVIFDPPKVVFMKFKTLLPAFLR